MNSELLAKYNVPCPRYTSYPTVPFWDHQPPESQVWEARVGETFALSNHTSGISLYIHLPFCEKLCTYCGCNTRITINHAVERVYMEALWKEWQLYLDFLKDKPRLREIHLGGGTPTFFSPSNLRELLERILQTSQVCEDHEFSFEAHPGNTTEAHLRALHDIGFTRVSIGVQDFDPVVLEAINRIQTYDNVRELTEKAREVGFESVNFDLVYGLPLQREERFAETVGKVIELKPDRVALYAYAHVPWVKPGQRKFTEEDLPGASRKLELYRSARMAFLEAGYGDIGMDHFALKTDSLYQASRKNVLHRNFMGYTVTNTRLLIGLGASSISDCGTAFIQNEKKIETYYARLKEGQLPISKGHLMTDEDIKLGNHIRNLMCRFETEWSDISLPSGILAEVLDRLREPEADGLVSLMPDKLRVLERGKPFVRNICMAFDVRLWEGKERPVLFSKAV